jgi:hypothetical protein
VDGSAESWVGNTGLGFRDWVYSDWERGKRSIYGGDEAGDRQNSAYQYLAGAKSLQMLPRPTK